MNKKAKVLIMVRYYSPDIAWINVNKPLSATEKDKWIGGSRSNPYPHPNVNDKTKVVVDAFYEKNEGIARLLYNAYEFRIDKVKTSNWDEIIPDVVDLIEHLTGRESKTGTVRLYDNK